MEMNLPGQQAAVSAAQAVVEESLTDFPDVPETVSDLVQLPGGLVRGDKVIRDAVVRELTGEHEERLAKAERSGNQFHFFDTLLECGTVRIGDEPESDTTKILQELLVGDRDQLLVAIRQVTYGPEVEIFGWPCPVCGEPTDLKLDITEDIPVKKLGDPRIETEFEVPLRRGRKALCALLNGADQRAINEDPKITTAERNTLILSRCIREIVEKDGQRQNMSAWPSLARQMLIPDRRAVLSALAERSPGPQYNGIKLTHDSCGKEVTLALAIGDLFLI